MEGVRRFLAESLFSPLDGVTLGDWVTLMKRHALDVSPRYWPRVAFTTVMAAVNSGVGWLEQRRYGPRLAQVAVEPPVFILGHHRGGTTHLWNVLSRDPAFAHPSILQAVFPSSFLVFEPWIRGLAQHLTMRKRPQDNVQMGPDSPIEEERALCTDTFMSMQMARHFPRKLWMYRPYLTLREVSFAERERWKAAFLRFAQKLTLRHGPDRILLFKSPDHTGKVRVLRELFSDARFVHISRDPFDVFRSTLQMELKTRHIYAFQSWKGREALIDFILWRYRTMYDAYIEDMRSVPEDRRVEVSYEAFVDEPEQTLARIYRSLGLERSREARERQQVYLRAVAHYRNNDHAELDDWTRRRIYDAWRPCFDRWGYEGLDGPSLRSAS